MADELRSPVTELEWHAYHAIRRRVLFERRGRGSVYDPNHPDESRPDHYPLVLWRNHEAVAVIRVDIDAEAGEATFRRVAVREDVQRLGYGRRLLAMAEEFAARHGCQRINSYVDVDAVGFYERCGFHPVSSERLNAETVLMTKELRTVFAARVPVLVISGTVGVGKSSVLDEIHALLCAADISHACIDADALSLSWPERGPFNQTMVFENLASVWANFSAAGARRLVIAGVIETVEDLAALQRAVSGAEITVCRLSASEQTRATRIRAREIGTAADWHLRRTNELQAILDASTLEDFTVSNDGRAVGEAALEILTRVHWLDGAGRPAGLLSQ